MLKWTKDEISSGAERMWMMSESDAEHSLTRSPIPQHDVSRAARQIAGRGP